MLITNSLKIPTSLPEAILRVTSSSEFLEKITDTDFIIHYGNTNLLKDAGDVFLIALNDSCIRPKTIAEDKHLIQAINYVAFKKEYYKTLKVVIAKFMESGGGVFSIDEESLYATPKQVFEHLKDVMSSICHGVHADYKLYLDDNQKGMMVNDFFVWWPILFHTLSKGKHVALVQKSMKGNSMEVFLELMNSMKMIPIDKFDKEGNAGKYPVTGNKLYFK